jgi:hypothetical protein
VFSKRQLDFDPNFSANPGLDIIARAHSNAEVEYLTRLGASLLIMGEREIARGIYHPDSPHLCSKPSRVTIDRDAGGP